MPAPVRGFGLPIQAIALFAVLSSPTFISLPMEAGEGFGSFSCLSLVQLQWL